MRFRNADMKRKSLSPYSTVLSFHSSGQDVWDYRRTGVKETRQQGRGSDGGVVFELAEILVRKIS